MKKMIVLVLTITLTMHLASTVFAAFMPSVLYAVESYEEQFVGLKAKLRESERWYLNPLEHLALSPLLRLLPLLKVQWGFSSRASPQ